MLYTTNIMTTSSTDLTGLKTMCSVGQTDNGRIHYWKNLKSLLYNIIMNPDFYDDIRNIVKRIVKLPPFVQWQISVYIVIIMYILIK